jgi:hypothetical protein
MVAPLLAVSQAFAPQPDFCFGAGFAVLPGEIFKLFVVVVVVFHKQVFIRFIPPPAIEGGLRTANVLNQRVRFLG